MTVKIFGSPEGGRGRIVANSGNGFRSDNRQTGFTDSRKAGSADPNSPIPNPRHSPRCRIRVRRQLHQCFSLAFDHLLSHQPHVAVVRRRASVVQRVKPVVVFVDTFPLYDHTFSWQKLFCLAFCGEMLGQRQVFLRRRLEQRQRAGCACANWQVSDSGETARGEHAINLLFDQSHTVVRNRQHQLSPVVPGHLDLRPVSMFIDTQHDTERPDRNGIRVNRHRDQADTVTGRKRSAGA